MNELRNELHPEPRRCFTFTCFSDSLWVKRTIVQIFLLFTSVTALQHWQFLGLTQLTVTCIKNKDTQWDLSEILLLRLCFCLQDVCLHSFPFLSCPEVKCWIGTRPDEAIFYILRSELAKLGQNKLGSFMVSAPCHVSCHIVLLKYAFAEIKLLHKITETKSGLIMFRTIEVFVIYLWKTNSLFMLY